MCMCLYAYGAEPDGYFVCYDQLCLYDLYMERAHYTPFGGARYMSLGGARYAGLGGPPYSLGGACYASVGRAHYTLWVGSIMFYYLWYVVFWGTH